MPGAFLIPDWGIDPLALPALALGIIFVKWVQNLAATYSFTEERLIIRRGIIFKSIDEIELYRVKDVRLDFTLLNQMGEYRHDHDQLERRDDPRRRPCHAPNRERPGPARALRRLVDTARQKRRVREIDMVHEDI